MTAYQSPWHPANEIERLLCSLAGVVSARVVANPMGRIDEIHVLSSPMLNPKQVVRNVESALSAGLGIVIDRRIVSVAQIRRDAIDTVEEPEEPAAGPTAAAPTPVEATPATTAVETRFVFVRYDARNQTNLESECHVTIRLDRTHFTGTGSGAATPEGRALAGARAVFAAIAAAGADDGVGLEGASGVETHGRSYVLSAARGLAGRNSRPLTGVAPLRRSPEEAAILASLQATNRWIGLES
jgi:hypothetical protein